jgi:hypothetical protein
MNSYFVIGYKRGEDVKEKRKKIGQITKRGKSLWKEKKEDKPIFDVSYSI